jgi:hypothetical protein
LQVFVLLIIKTRENAQNVVETDNFLSPLKFDGMRSKSTFQLLCQPFTKRIKMAPMKREAEAKLNAYDNGGKLKQSPMTAWSHLCNSRLKTKNSPDLSEGIFS